MFDLSSKVWLILDLITVALALITIIHYARKGFIQSLYSALKWILSFLLIRWLFSPITVWLKSMGLETYLTGLFEGWIGSAGNLGNEEFIDGLPLPRMILDYLKANNNVAGYAQMGVNDALSFVATTLADIVVNLIAMLGLLIVFQILFFLVGKVLNLITTLPILHSLNSVLGGALGVGLAFVFICVLAAVFYITAALTKNPELIAAMEQTKVLSILNRWNFLLQYAASQLPMN